MIINNQGQNKPVSNNADKKDETTKATTKATTTVKKKKQQSYYVCNGCGYKTTGSSAFEKMSAHCKKQMLARNMKCSGYHTSWE